MKLSFLNIRKHLNMTQIDNFSAKSAVLFILEDDLYDHDPQQCEEEVRIRLMT